jgi:hypothetical protein
VLVAAACTGVRLSSIQTRLGLDSRLVWGVFITWVFGNRHLQRIVLGGSWSVGSFGKVFLTIFWVEPDEIGRCFATGDAGHIARVRKANHVRV